jgi:uroporphyrinogen-III synthase
LHYGERSETLAETLLARGALLEELWLYKWLLPEDTRPLEQLVERIIAGDVDALAITCQIQFRHLMEVAARRSLDHALLDALTRVVVATVGPTCTAVLHAHGVEVDVIPNSPKMGPLVVSLMRSLDRRSRPAETSRFITSEAVS